MKFKYGIFILFFSINCFAHHPGNQIDADKPYPSINLTVIKDKIDGYNIFIDLKNFLYISLLIPIILVVLITALNII